MSLLRALRPLLAARSSGQAAPLRGKVTFRNKGDSEISMSPSTTYICYAFCVVASSVLLYGGYYFITQANARDAERAEFFRRTGEPEWKPKPWPPP